MLVTVPLGQVAFSHLAPSRAESLSFAPVTFAVVNGGIAHPRTIDPGVVRAGVRIRGADTGRQRPTHFVCLGGAVDRPRSHGP